MDILELITDANLARLVEYSSDQPLITILIPTFSTGPDVLKNHIYFKNTIYDIESAIQSYVKVNDKVASQVKKLKELIDDREFWQHQKDGLAIYATEDFIELYKLPISLSDFTSISSMFYLRPLFEARSPIAEYALLELSDNSNRLLLCSNSSYKIIEMPKDVWPESLVDSSPTARNKQDTTQASGGSKKIVQGHKDQNKTDSESFKYFRILDDAIGEYFQTKDIPLMLATTRENYDLYKQQSRNMDVLPDFIEGNCDDVRDKDLWLKSLEVLKKYRLKVIEGIVAEIETSKQLLTSEREVSIKAYEGAVEKLFIDKHTQSYGHIGDIETDIEFKGFDDNESIDFLNFSAIETFKHGGGVYVLDESVMPKKSSIAAVLRY